MTLESNEIDHDSYLRYLKLVGEEAKRQTLLEGRAYQKENVIKKLKMPRRNKQS